MNENACLQQLAFAGNTRLSVELVGSNMATQKDTIKMTCTKRGVCEPERLDFQQDVHEASSPKIMPST